jgi:transposase
MSKEVFVAYIEHFLAPTLREGQVVVMDNLLSPQGQKDQEVKRSERLLTALLAALSTRSLNPIEEAFSKVKRLLRVIGARTKEALVEAIGTALDAVGTREAEASSLTAVMAGWNSIQRRRCTSSPKLLASTGVQRVAKTGRRCPFSPSELLNTGDQDPSNYFPDRFSPKVGE